MKRYLVFVHETYEPRGGFHDYVNGFDNEGLALSCLNARLFELTASCKASGHILDTETGKLTKEVEAEKRGR